MKKFFRWTRSERKRSARAGAHARPAGHAYHAVTIRYSQAQACDAVRQLEGQAFLSPEAPELPLSACARRAECRCHYRHQTDRRATMRRDSDHGLPGRFYDGLERRGAMADRRHERRR